MKTFKKNVPLARYSSFRIGGTARYFFDAEDISEAIEAVLWARSRRLPVFILGGGTNILFRTVGFEGLILRVAMNTLQAEGDTVSVGAGVLISDLLEFTASCGLSGLEWAGGLPGTVGGAIRGNAGCFGGEIKDRLVEVESLDISEDKPRIVVRRVDECSFDYRTSIFKIRDGKEIILQAKFALEHGNAAEIHAQIEEKIRYRKERHPMEYPNIGSIFKNVPLENILPALREEFRHVIKTDPFPLVPTAYLIAEAGLRGVSCGGAMISPKHPNFIVNVLNAQSEEVLALISLVKEEVKKKFSIELEEEVVIL